MKKLSLSLVLCALAFSAPAMADAQLAQNKQCMQCHAVAKDTIGPSFQNIAKRWKGKPEAQTALLAVIQKGSDGSGGTHWGMKAKMPDTSERPTITADEGRRIITWMLAQ